MSWTWGTNTLAPGQSQRWWLWWPGDPGLEVLGVQTLTPGAEVDCTDPGVQHNADGSTTYFITVTNAGSAAVQYHFRGVALGWTWGTSTIGPGVTQRWWLWWPNYPGVEIIGVQVVTPGVEMRYGPPSAQIAADGSTTYFVDITNTGAAPAEYRFRGAPVC